MKCILMLVAACASLSAADSPEEVAAHVAKVSAACVKQNAGKGFFLKSFDGLKSPGPKIQVSDIPDMERLDEATFEKIRSNKFTLIDCAAIVDPRDDPSPYTVHFEYMVKSPKVPFALVYETVATGLYADRLNPDFTSIVSSTNLNPMNPAWPPAIRKAIQNKSVLVGMTPAQATAAWGEPEDVNSTTTARGTREQWVYGGHDYLYFENGRLVAIQN